MLVAAYFFVTAFNSVSEEKGKRRHRSSGSYGERSAKVVPFIL